MNESATLNRPSRQLVIQALILSLGAAVALGFARFSYALLLPAMRSELEWSYAAAGSMNTANALGYLLGALSTALIMQRTGIARCFWFSLLLTGAGLLATGLTDNFSALLLCRFLTGITCATTFISGATLASHLSKDGHGGLVLGLYFGGVGTGIVLAGLGLPQLLEHKPGLWPLPWLAMGCLSFVFTVIVRPAALKVSIAPTQSAKAITRRFPTELLASLVAYFLFGLGYISYMTFIIAHLRSSDVSTTILTLFWLLLGLSTFVSAFVWQSLLDRSRGSGLALAIILTVVATGTAIPLFSTSLIAILISGVLFGGSFLSVVTAVTNIARCSLPSHRWAFGIALFTLIFSIGQALGPVVAGVMADQNNNFSSGFALSAACLTLGAALALLQKHNDIE